MKPLRIQVLQHVPFEDIGCIADWIHQNGHLVNYTKFYESDILPALTQIDWVIIMGGPMSIHDEQEFPWLKKEKAFVKHAIAENKVVIGICLGAQLIADVLGGQVTKNEHKEIGWFPIEKVENTNLFQDFETSFSVLHWHGETFSIPKGATHLFQSKACKNQGFLYQNKVIGFQFHIEVTPASLWAMAENCQSDIQLGLPYVQSFEEITQNQAYIQKNNQLMFNLLNQLAN